jgi:hypothetical protein
VASGEFEEEWVDESVIEDEVGVGEELGAADGDQAGISRPGPDKPDFAEGGHSRSRRWK